MIAIGFFAATASVLLALFCDGVLRLKREFKWSSIAFACVFTGGVLLMIAGFSRWLWEVAP